MEILIHSTNKKARNTKDNLKDPHLVLLETLKGFPAACAWPYP